MNTQKNGQDDHSKRPLLELIIEGKKFEWFEQYITGKQLKELRGLPLDCELFLDIVEPWKDDAILNDETVDLARPGIEQFYIKQKLKYSIDGKNFETEKQYIKGSQIRRQGNIAADFQIYLDNKQPWEDDLIEDDEIVDLARPGKEKFYSKKEITEFIIIVNGREKQWNQKTISFTQVVELAFGNYQENPNTVYTVTYAKGPHQNPEGSMVKGDKVFVTNKMVFNVTATNKS
ncbi:multiubiquitin domain-containing protein [Flavobacterium sp. UBA6195]|uniref:multiubiquitin domain-containing protein n=1 Tax=Flavobacterium sp. UBA6195 TaxID=1946554 RepID=UPI0025C6D5A0|nr:multiubiquitin domain-containing protein [Flavobacterium sp. UBA6195]